MSILSDGTRFIMALRVDKPRICLPVCSTCSTTIYGKGYFSGCRIVNLLIELKTHSYVFYIKHVSQHIEGRRCKNLILIRHLSMLPQAPRAWQTPTSWSIHSGMVLGSLHYAGFFDLTPPRGRGRGRWASIISLPP